MTGAAYRPGSPRLTWEHVDLGDPVGTPPRPPGAAVWRSVSRGGDTETSKSRRAHGMPAQGFY